MNCMCFCGGLERQMGGSKWTKVAGIKVVGSGGNAIFPFHNRNEKELFPPTDTIAAFSSSCSKSTARYFWLYKLQSKQHSGLLLRLGMLAGELRPNGRTETLHTRAQLCPKPTMWWLTTDHTVSYTVFHWKNIK